MANTYIMYMIKCGDDNIEGCYIGSTKDFKGRKHVHKNNCNNENLQNYNLRLYKFIRNNGGWNEFEMKPIEEFRCDSKLQARIREQYWIEYHKSDLNSNNAYTSEEQGKIQGKEYRANHSEYDKEYYANNQDKIKDYLKTNKDKIAEYKNTKHDCSCGGKYTNTHKTKHVKTLMHQNYISTNSSDNSTLTN